MTAAESTSTPHRHSQDRSAEAARRAHTAARAAGPGMIRQTEEERAWELTDPG